MKKHLPIGSVVLLKEAERRLMIVGLLQKEAETDRVWDYSAVLYPDGMLDSNSLYLFDEEQIELLFFLGFQDVESFHFLNALAKQDEAESGENLENKPLQG